MSEALLRGSEEAWSRVPPARELSAGLGSFTRQRIERMLSLVSGLGCLVLGVQAFVAALGSSEEGPGWRLPLLIATFGALVIMLLVCAIGRGVAIGAGLFAVVFPVVLVLWPAATAGGPSTGTAQPWIWFLVNVATVAAMLAFPLSLQVAWAAVIPLLFGVVRMAQAGFASALWFAVGLDVSFALILGGVLTALGWVFRSVATRVDRSRADAVETYAGARASEALEQERVAVAALMHDSVLAALIAAERAHTPRERTLAAAMAREALTRLANAERDVEEGSDEPWEADAVADAIAVAARELGVELDVQRRVQGASDRIPGRVARALVLAATQSVANALEHAGGAGLSVVVVGDGPAQGVQIDVQDHGPGFDVDDVPEDRLGIRASVLARVAAVGGRAHIDSGPRGTTVSLAWKAGEAS